MTIRSEIWTMNVHSLGIWDIRESVTLWNLISRSLKCTCTYFMKNAGLHLHPVVQFINHKEVLDFLLIQVPNLLSMGINISCGTLDMCSHVCFTCNGLFHIHVSYQAIKDTSSLCTLITCIYYALDFAWMQTHSSHIINLPHLDVVCPKQPPLPHVCTHFTLQL